MLQSVTRGEGPQKVKQNSMTYFMDSPNNFYVHTL